MKNLFFMEEQLGMNIIVVFNSHKNQTGPV